LVLQQDDFGHARDMGADGMNVQVSEPRREIALLVRRDVLILEEQHLVA